MSKQTYLQTVATRVASAVVLTTLIAVYALPAQAAGGAMHYLDAKVNLDDRASLQNGARVRQLLPELSRDVVHAL